MVHLTPEQQAEVRQAHEPVSVIDPGTGQEYVLITKETYARLHEIFDDGELSEQEQMFLLREGGMEAGWNDPEMDVYDKLDPRKKP